MPGWLAVVIIAEFVIGPWLAVRRLSEVDTYKELDRRWTILIATPFVALVTIFVGVIVHAIVLAVAS